MTAAARLYLLAGATLCGLYVALHGNTLIYEGTGTLAWAAMAYGVWRNRPARWRAWLLFASGQCLYATGDFVFFTVYGGSPSFPSVADAGYLLASVVFAVALYLLLGRADTRRQEAVVLADSAIVSLAVALLLWATFFEGAESYGTGLARLVSISYPIFDLVLLGMCVRVLLERGRRTPSYVMLVAGVVLLVLSDAWYVLPALTDDYVAGTWRDLGWIGAYVLFGASALHPSMTTFVRRRPNLLPLRRVVLLGAALVLVDGAALAETLIKGHANPLVFAGIGGVMAAYVTIRIVSLVRELERAKRDTAESERRFRMVFERAPIGISVGRDGIMSETNPAFQRLLGYSGEELARMHYADVTHPDDRDLGVQFELDSGARDSFVIDKRYRHKDGHAIDTHVHVALDLDDGLGISLVEDVTARRELEDQLRQSQKMEAVGKLAGGIAHDFNNLMTAVLGYSDLVLNRLEAGDVNREKIEAIRESAVRASELTRQLLAFGRRQMLQARELYVRDVVEGMESLLQRLIGDHIRVEIETRGEPAVVRADPTQLEQVVLNLAVNARDAMPRGGTLRIEVESEERDVVLRVSDTGTGMDEATRARIFEPFFTTKPVGEGSGLGLSTVHGIVGQSGGAIDVATVPGAGTTFTVRLPRAGLPLVAGAATLVD